jgi:hypothetical protein
MQTPLITGHKHSFIEFCPWLYLEEEEEEEEECHSSSN